MKNHIKWLGHASFEVTTTLGKKILIDPWLTGNPMCPLAEDELPTPDLVLVTHDHHDHYGSDIPALLRKNSGIMIAQPEVVVKALKEGATEEQIVNNGSGMNIGGTVTIEGIAITMTQAVHSSNLGSPTGFIITLEDGKVIYHAGDTGIFASMGLFAELYDIDLALLPIGGIFTMDPLQASLALRLLKPKMAIPMHYQTFPLLEQTAKTFIQLAKEKAPQVIIKPLAPGESLSI